MGMLDGRVAIITGGGRGIGASISRLFAAEGASLVINDLGGNPDGTGSDAGPATAIADELTTGGTKAVADGGDIADTATGERLVQTAVDQFGKLDIVVNVAGILRDRMIFNLPPEDWDAVIRVHLRGHSAPSAPPRRTGAPSGTRPETTASSTSRRARACTGHRASPTTPPPSWASSASPTRWPRAWPGTA